MREVFDAHGPSSWSLAYAITGDAGEATDLAIDLVVWLATDDTVGPVDHRTELRVVAHSVSDSGWVSESTNGRAPLADAFRSLTWAEQARLWAVNVERLVPSEEDAAAIDHDRAALRSMYLANLARTAPTTCRRSLDRLAEGERGARQTVHLASCASCRATANVLPRLHESLETLAYAPSASFWGAVVKDWRDTVEPPEPSPRRSLALPSIQLAGKLAFAMGSIALVLATLLLAGSSDSGHRQQAEAPLVPALIGPSASSTPTGPATVAVATPAAFSAPTVLVASAPTTAASAPASPQPEVTPASTTPAPPAVPAAPVTASQVPSAAAPTPPATEQPDPGPSPAMTAGVDAGPVSAAAGVGSPSDPCAGVTAQGTSAGNCPPPAPDAGGASVTPAPAGSVSVSAL